MLNERYRLFTHDLKFVIPVRDQQILKSKVLLLQLSHFHLQLLEVQFPSVPCFLRSLPAALFSLLFFTHLLVLIDCEWVCRRVMAAAFIAIGWFLGFLFSLFRPAGEGAEEHICRGVILVHSFKSN
ncbi:unnamed protein product [Moneuplotes crassus]|uniref:Transmembrane protein n=1 Tax=Euplotes crassus TaxID=5936 RepID=A0AAD1XJV5_EUPCR|nr:unnamed protein product [Moneuplotes crassus]